MHEFRSFHPLNETVEDRLHLDPCLATMGRIAHNFANLEGHLASGIARTLRLTGPLADLIPGAMSFRGKVDVVSALLMYHPRPEEFNCDQDTRDELRGRLVEQCLKAEELRNQSLGIGVAPSKQDDVLYLWTWQTSSWTPT